MLNIGYCMPSVHSGLCTLDWMYGIRAKHFYCPMVKDQNFDKRCFYPPPKAELLRKLELALRPLIDEHRGKESQPYENTLNYMQEHLPDVNWLITVLAIWAPDDEIFEQRYKYVKQRSVPIEA